MLETGLKPKALAAFRSSALMFSKDLRALPEDAFTQNFGGASRTVADMVFEVILVNDHVALILEGKEPFDWPEGGFIVAPTDFSEKAEIIRAFEASKSAVTKVIDALSEADMLRTVVDEHGEHHKYDRIRFMAFHMAYHSGQINFIQTLMGDSQMHW